MPNRERSKFDSIVSRFDSIASGMMRVTLRSIRPLPLHYYVMFALVFALLLTGGAWLNRIGMLLEFLSFFAVAPEIVTEIRDDEKWLVGLESRLEQIVKWGLPLVTALLMGGSVLVAFVDDTASRRDAYLHTLHLFPILIAIGALLAAFTGVSYAVLARRKWVPRLLRTLADDKQIRRRWLKIGVGMFLLGWVLQFIATF